jgi:23S rRNA pseudouridine1911/1915/1917 synthase
VKAREFQIDCIKPGGRLDRVLADHLSDISRSRIQKLIRMGYASVDGIVITKTGYALEGGEQLCLYIPAPTPTRLTPEVIPLDIVYEDDDCLLVNKSAGMVVHPSVGHTEGTLVHAILGYAPDLRGIGEEIRPGVVHRLDKDTSGLILFAKHDSAHQWFQTQFKDRKVKKTYFAITDGQPPTPSGRIEAGIGRDPKHRQKMAVLPAGKSREAVTHYRELERFQQHSLLEVKPVTGRTHQIRVHLAFIEAPVLGDKVYGRRRVSLAVQRQMLHAGGLEIMLPASPTSREFHAPLPHDFEETLNQLRGVRG